VRACSPASPPPQSRSKLLPLNFPFTAAIILKLRWQEPTVTGAPPGHGAGSVGAAAPSAMSGDGAAALQPRIHHHADWWGGKHLLNPAEDGFFGVLARGRRIVGGMMQAAFVKATGGEKALEGDSKPASSAGRGISGGGGGAGASSRTPFVLSGGEDVGAAPSGSGAGGIEPKVRGHGDPLGSAAAPMKAEVGAKKPLVPTQALGGRENLQG